MSDDFTTSPPLSERADPIAPADGGAGEEHTATDRQGVPLPQDAHGPAPRSGGDTVNTRKIARQATSAVAHVGPVPQRGDPLLAFTPVPHKAPRRNSITAARQRAFIAHLAATGIVANAAMHIGKSTEALYKLRHRPGAEEFSAAWDAALERGLQRLEDGALARAIDGTPEWKSDGNGGLITYGRRYNEALVMFFLRNRRPERYSEHIRPGHPVYERIRREIQAAQPTPPPAGRAVPCEADAAADAHPDAPSRECALSRHFAERIAQAGADDGGPAGEPRAACGQISFEK